MLLVKHTLKYTKDRTVHQQEGDEIVGDRWTTIRWIGINPTILSFK